MLQWWSDEDREILKKLYPKATKEEILKALNNEYRQKTWTAIQKEASRLKIKRDEEYKKVGRPKKKPRIHLGHKELAEILKKNLTIDEIAKKLRTTPETVRRYIQKYGL
jgi:predicted transcriptional regulator